MASFLRRFCQSQKGSVVVEAAFVLPLFLAFTIGLAEFCRLYWVRSSIQLAVTEAGRYVMINTSANNASLTSQITNSLYGLNINLFSINFSNETNNGINYKVISASYDYTLLADDLIGVGPIALNFTSKVPLLQ